MKRTVRIFSRVAGILIFALSPMCGALAGDVASAESSAPVRVAQAESEARRHNDPRPITLGDLYRVQDQLNERMDRLDARMDRIEDQIEHLGGRLDLALTVMLGGLLGIVAVLLARREKPRESARLKSDADKPPPAPAH